MRILISILFSTIALLSFGGRSPESVANEILSASPRLKTLHRGVEAEVSKAATEGNLPDPELEGEFLAAPVGEQNRWGAGISWGLDWPGVYSARKEAAMAQTKIAYWNAMSEERYIAVNIRRLILDYILQSRQIEVVNDLISATDSLSRLAEKARRGGEMTLLDLNKIALEKVGLESRFAGYDNERNQTIAALSEIAGKDCSPLLAQMELSFPMAILPNETELKELIAASPQVMAMEETLNSSNAERKVIAREGLPSLSIGYRHAFEDGNHFNGGSIGVSVPIFSNRGKKKALDATSLAASTNIEEMRLTMESRIRADLQRVRRLDADIAKVAPILESTDNLDLLMKAYKSGVITLIDYFNERNYFLEATLSLLELRHSAATARLDVLAFSQVQFN